MKNTTIDSGFTLIETLVAVSILTLSVAGPLFTANRAIVAAENARNQLTASYLAQEGIEYVRMMRDNEFLVAYRTNPTTASSAAWTDFLTGGSVASITQCRTSTCTLDPSRDMGTGSGLSLSPCSGASCAPIRLTNCIRGTGGLVCTPPNIYTLQNLSGSVQTAFTRTIQVVEQSASDERIVSTVFWEYHNTPYSVTVYDHLTPWQ